MSNCLDAQRRLLVELRAECVGHEILTFPSGELKQLQIIASRDLVAVLLPQSVVRHPKIAVGKHLFAVLVVFKGTRLSYQTVDHMPVVDQTLFAPDQARHSLHFLSRIPDDDLVHLDEAVHLPADQTTGDRIRILLHSDDTAATHTNARTECPVIDSLQRQFVQVLLLQKEFVLSMTVASFHDLTQKFAISVEGLKVATAAQQQCLVNSRFEVSV